MSFENIRNVAQYVFYDTTIVNLLIATHISKVGQSALLNYPSLLMPRGSTHILPKYQRNTPSKNCRRYTDSGTTGSINSQDAQPPEYLGVNSPGFYLYLETHPFNHSRLRKFSTYYNILDHYFPKISKKSVKYLTFHSFHGLIFTPALLFSCPALPC